jgi:predicted dehydrogenase
VGEPLNIGLVGCGAISGKYLETIARLPSLHLTAAADLDLSRAQAVSPRALTVDALVEDPDVDVVLNLTVPVAHAEVALKAIAAGKDVYGEKPFAANLSEAGQVLQAAEAAGVRVGCAPDTVLGTGTQTARHAIDEGAIGVPIAATASMVTPGHEFWHPNPDFYYVPGGGPLMDMGPYYISSLVTLLGPVASVIGAGSHLRPARNIHSGPRAGENLPVLVDTHVTGVMTHESGVLSTLVMSFDAVATQSAYLEVHGSNGSMVVPDPNVFDGDVRLRRLGDPDWQTLDVSAGYLNGGRGCGLADMAAEKSPRASGLLAFHVLDVMESLLLSAKSGQAVTIDSTCERPAPVPLGPMDNTP